MHILVLSTPALSGSASEFAEKRF